MEQQFYVTGYIGEGAKHMLLDLESMERVRLIEQEIDNRCVRFLYYRLYRLTNGFKKCHIIKKIFYPWFTILRLHYEENVENCILFFNSGFCRGLDIAIVKRLRKKNRNLKLVLYIVDPMIGFCSAEHLKIIESMDLVYSINKADCENYNFIYYPLVYSKEIKDKENAEDLLILNKENTDLYYLGSGSDRTKTLLEIHQRCKAEGIKTDFHVLSREEKLKREEIAFHNEAISYYENIELLKRTNCILEIMHEKFDNPTQRYSEAIAYNKKLLTNNEKAATFEFYNPRYIQIFQSVEDIDTNFIKRRENVDYGYREEFSPRFFIQEIAHRIMEGTWDGRS